MSQADQSSTRAERAALSTLDVSRLRELVEEASLRVPDKRNRELLLDALCSDQAPTYESMLVTCGRDELKAMCRATGRSDDGREKAPLIARLLTPAPRDVASAHSESEWRLRVLQLLSRAELRELVDEHDVGQVDRRNTAIMAEALAQLDVGLDVLVDDLQRSRLKELCRVAGLDDSGKEKAPLIARIVTQGGRFATSSRIVSTIDLTHEVLANLLGTNFSLEESSNLWPAKATGNREVLDLYVRRIGPSRTPQERRFQNPGTESAIVARKGSLTLLLGVWLEHGLDRAVFVGFDAYRREGATTRFSCFAPLALLESAASTGFATHVSTSGEIIYAFRPQNLTRYLEAVRPKPGPVTSEKEVVFPVVEPSPADEDPGDRVEIRPKAGMFAAFARLNYKPWFALAELVDNAVQSYLANQDRLAVVTPGPLVLEIELRDGELFVFDRAAGIAFSEFSRAFSPASPPTNTSGLSEFGLGMKAAASWFAHEWTVRTSALGDPWERTVHFDVAAITKQGLDNLPVNREPAKPDAHYTELRMRRLRQQPRAGTLAKMKEHLASIYRLLIKDGTLKLLFKSTNGRVEELIYDEPSLLVAPPWNAPNAAPITWRRVINLEHGDKRVTGWAGLLENGKYARAGFAVFRRQRLIEGSVGEAYRPHLIFGAPNSFVSQRLVGELYVEGFDVTHTKDGIQWGAEEEDILHLLKQQLDSNEMPLIRQAQNFRSRNLASKLIPSFGGEALEAVSDDLASVEMAKAMERAPSQPQIADISLPPESGTVMQKRPFRMQIQAGKVWNVEVQTIRQPGAHWVGMSSEDDPHGTPTVIISVNLDHPFSEAHINGNEDALQPMMHLAACLCIAELQARLQGVKNIGTLRGNLNEMLRGAHAYTPVQEKEA